MSSLSKLVFEQNSSRRQTVRRHRIVHQRDTHKLFSLFFFFSFLQTVSPSPLQGPFGRNKTHVQYKHLLPVLVRVAGPKRLRNLRAPRLLSTEDKKRWIRLYSFFLLFFSLPFLFDGQTLVAKDLLNFSEKYVDQIRVLYFLKDFLILTDIYIPILGMPQM